MKATIARLGDVALIFNGKTPAKGEQRGRGHPVLKIKDISEHGLLKGALDSFIDVELAAKYRDRWIRCGDTLVLNAAHNADYVASKLYFADDRVADVLPTGEWLLVRPNASYLHPGYVNYWLRSPSTRKQTKFLVKGIHLYPKDVASLEIALPSLEEQGRIVDLLSRAEGIVHLRREAQTKAQAIIPALFLKTFGDPSMNPMGWPTKQLSDIAEVISGVAKGRKLAPGDGIEMPYMRVANVKDGYLDLADVKAIEIKRSEIEKLLIRPGDLLMTEGGDPDKLGRAALWSGEIGACVHQNHIFKVRSDRSRVLPIYLRALAGSAYGKAYFLSVAKKTTGIASINKTQLSAFPVLLPPIQLQQSFAAHIASIESIAAQQRQAMIRSEGLFRSLVARAFTASPLVASVQAMEAAVA